MRFLMAVSMLGVAACGPKMVGPIIPIDPNGGMKCRVSASAASPLVTEWAASEKANLEALLRTGGVAVAYSGCTMRVLPQCRLRGNYSWQRTTPSSDILEINNEDDLYAKLPLGAASLEGELKRSGQLNVQTTVAGQLRLEGVSTGDIGDDGECAQATHIVGALSVGAFALYRGGSAEAKLGAGAGGVEVGGGRKQSVGLLRSAGDPASCSGSTDAAPHADCRSPIQVFLWTIPGRAAEEGPPGTVKVDLLSANANNRWDVYVDDEVVCTTPCTRWLDPDRPLLLRTRADAPDKIRLSNLRPHGDEGPLQLQAHGVSQGEFLTGLTFTAIGGMAVITGITLSSLGCLADQGDGFCTGGLISLGAGTIVTAGAIWLMLDSRPRAEIVPTMRAGGVNFVIGPGFAAGTF